MTASETMHLGDYRLIRRIKLGGMAVVYLAESPQGEPVAVKRLLPAASEDPEVVLMFHAEAALMGMLNHPRVARLLDREDGDGDAAAPFIVYEFLDGVDLATLRRRAIQEGRLPSSTFVASVGWQAADALDYVHNTERRIVHRDISPHNLMLLRTGRLKLIDFGIAKFEGSPCQTATGILKGKHAYMSPEQVGERPLDGRSDVFSLGATLYELATCTRLFKAPTPIQSLRLIEQAIVEPVLQRAPTVDPRLAAVIESCLTRRPEDRPTSGELAARLLPLTEAEGRDAEGQAKQFLNVAYPDGLAPLGSGEDLREYRNSLRSAEMDGQETTDQLGHSNATIVASR